MTATLKFSLPLLALSIGAAPVFAAGDAAPSSHFVFDDNFDGDIIINEVRVPADGEATYTYYETLGWRGKGAGYAGIQAHPKARNYIFSIWDHKEHKAPIRAVHTGPGTKTEKFGGEGTGLKSWNFELGWDTGVWYTLVSRCWPVGDHTHYGFWVRSAKTGEWTHLVTMDVAAEGALFKGGTDAFIEDWLETGKNKRTTHLRGGWKRKTDRAWHAFAGGRYSVNHWDLDPGKRSFNFKTNWDGGVAEDAGGKFYYMVAGGADTMPTSENPSKHAIARAEKKPAFDPMAFRSVKAEPTPDGKVEVSWELDPKTLPQFKISLSIHREAFGPREPIARATVDAPHLREALIELPAGINGENLFLRISGCDILDNTMPTIVRRLRG